MAWQASWMRSSRCRRASSSKAGRSAGLPCRCTGTMALVRGVIARSTRAGSRFSDESTSLKTGRAPAWTMALAVAMKVNGLVMTSSPGPTPLARRARNSAAVPFEVATAKRAPLAAATESSKALTRAPWAKAPERITSRTAASSSGPNWGRAIGIRASAIPRSWIELVLPVTSGAGARLVEPGSALADETAQPRGVAEDQAVRRDVAGDDRAGPHHGEAADADPGEYRAAPADGGSLLHLDAADPPVLAVFQLPVRRDRPRQAIVEQAAVGADEDAVFQDRSLEDGDPVLELDPIADDDADVDVDAFGQDAVGADACSLAHLRLVPDPRARSDRRRGRDVSGGVDLRPLIGLGLPRQDDVAVAGRADHRRPAPGQALQAGLQAAVERGGQRPVEERERPEAIGLRASLPQPGTLDQAVELAQAQAAGSHLVGRALAKPEAAQAAARDPSGGFQPGVVHRLQEQGQAGSVGAAEDGDTGRLEDSCHLGDALSRRVEPGDHAQREHQVVSPGLRLQGVHVAPDRMDLIGDALRSRLAAHHRHHGLHRVDGVHPQATAGEGNAAEPGPGAHVENPGPRGQTELVRPSQRDLEPALKEDAARVLAPVDVLPAARALHEVGVDRPLGFDLLQPSAPHRTATSGTSAGRAFTFGLRGRRAIRPRSVSEASSRMDMRKGSGSPRENVEDSLTPR